MEMQTMQLKLIRSPQSDYFIASDNPVVILNQFSSQGDSPRSFAGFSLTGFQLLLPVSPDLCLFFFDQKVYKVGSRSSRLVVISPEDVEIINTLQFQSADSCVYFHDLSLEAQLRAWTTKYGALRSSVRDTLATHLGL
jgi:hypothetical protein